MADYNLFGWNIKKIEPSINKNSEIINKLHTETLNVYREEYKELSETWRSLETKAQGNVAISGIFIGGLFAFVQNLKPESHLVGIIALCAAIICLLLSVIFSILVLKVRDINIPTFGDKTEKFAQDTVKQLECNDDSSDMLLLFIGEQKALWQQVNRDYKIENNKKASNLFRAQKCLAIAILSMAIVIFAKIFL